MHWRDLLYPFVGAFMWTACGVSTPPPESPPALSSPVEPAAPVGNAPSAPAPNPCETVDDCWASPGPRSIPIARPEAFKGRTFTVCHDGEGQPKCTNKVCTLVFYEC